MEVHPNLKPWGPSVANGGEIALSISISCEANFHFSFRIMF